VESTGPIKFVLHPMMTRAKSLPLLPGAYRLRLLMLDSVSTAPGQRVITVATDGPPTSVDIFQQTGQANQILELSYPVQVGPAGQVEVTLTPERGKALICGAILEPISTQANR
jgi:hypothetical protein